MRRIALIGFGGVGQAFAAVLAERGEDLRREMGLDARIVAVSDPFKGAVYQEGGLDLRALSACVREKGSVDAYPEGPGVVRGLDSIATIQETAADTIVEVSPTLPGGEPSIGYCRAAFASGKHVITSNKGPAALGYAELSAAAKAVGAYFGIEGTVMSGTPSLWLGKAALAGNRISEIRGILNGTTNYMLTRMEEGLEYDDALGEAQQLGYAEAEPSSDVDGHDAQFKIVILAQHVLGVPLRLEQVQRTGIRDLTRKDVEAAVRAGSHWKLLARVEVDGSEVRASVGPVRVPSADALASVRGALNAITYQCDLMGPVTLVGAGAGRQETAFALLADLIRIEQRAATGRSLA